MRFAIYSRKSRFTGKGESIDNQIDDCRRFILSNFPDTKEEEIYVYEDEGYSGKNTNRPQFQQMMTVEDKEPFDFIVVYRLDRISRNMSDFAVLMDKLAKKGTSFYSTNERFDTSTVSGQMMMTISAAFAQFERQIIAERVRDNVYKLAKTGRWLGGTPPLGFTSQNETYIDDSGIERKCHKLIENEKELALVRLIYAKYLELQSLSKLETFMINSGYKTRKNADFRVTTLRYIITNPTYCTADSKSYEFFRDSDCDIADIGESCNGEHGFLGYKKSQTKLDDSRTPTELSDWTIALGRHKGIISSADWIEAQEIITDHSRRYKRVRQPHNPTALLSGILRCKCGSYMRPRTFKANKQGEKPYSYMCELKERSKGEKCSCPNVSGRAADRMVCDALLNYQDDDSVFARYVNIVSSMGKKNEDIDSLVSSHKTMIAKKKKAISGLLRMAGEDGSISADYVHDELTSLHSEIEQEENEIKRLERLRVSGRTLETAAKNTESLLKTFKDNFDTLSTDNKRNFIRKCVSRIEWDGENIGVFLLG